MEEKHSKERIINLEVYTDGACKTMGRTMTFGGWSYIVLREGKKIHSRSESEFRTTNQRMELTAIAEALKYVNTIRKRNERVVIYSDSAYAINCYLKEWYINWQTNGWINANHEPVANQDLWCAIIPYFDNFWYTFVKVKGHNKVLWNEECDNLAQNAAEKLKTLLEV